jgi:CheY-like chemotaxis protein
MRQEMKEKGGKKILIVDDEKAIRDILSDIFVYWGYQVAVASSGIEALSLFVTRPFDLVLTDLTMPGIDGWAIATKVKEKSPNTHVCVMTAQDKQSVIKKLEGSCVDFALFKPFTLEDLERWLRGYEATEQKQRAYF